jgi:outer membrane lipoprotein-sorting protein
LHKTGDTMKKIVTGIYFALMFICGSVFSQTLTADQILDNVRQHFDEIQDYTVTITAQVNIEGLNVPDNKIKLYFKQPDKIHIESEHFAMVPREALRFNPSYFLNKFNDTLVGSEKQNDTVFYKIQLVPKSDEAENLHESFIWVDGARWVVTKLETGAAAERTVDVEFAYETVDAKYLLPSRISVHFEVQQEKDSTAEGMYNPERKPRSGTVVITYSDYIVNSGLSDDIFKDEEKKPK